MGGKGSGRKREARTPNEIPIIKKNKHVLYLARTFEDEVLDYGRRK